MGPQETAQAVISPENFIYFWIAMIVSLLILIGGWISVKRKHRVFTGEASGRLTVWILVAAAVMFLPVYFVPYQLEDSYHLLRPILLAIHNAMRLFILDGEFDFITESIRGLDPNLHVHFSAYAALLYVIAPVMFTFTVIFSIFEYAFPTFRLLFRQRTPLYVFSCLNEESAAMARSIIQPENADAGRKLPQSTIIFCSIPCDDDQKKSLAALVPDVPRKQAYVLLSSKAIDKQNISMFKKDITFFLMDREESINIRDAADLSSCLEKQAKSHPEKARRRKAKKLTTRILVYATTPASVPLIDSMSQALSAPDENVDRLMDIADREYKASDILEIRQNRMLDAFRKSIRDNRLSFSEPFSIMRIDIRTQMALRIIQDFQAADAFLSARSDRKTLTVTLLGLGGIGEELLENLLWMCQEYGHRLIVNVFDATGPELGEDPDEAHNPLYDKLAYKRPELIRTNREWQQDPASRPDTEADYDIRFFLGINCFSNRFTRLFDKNTEAGARLLGSDIILCSLGDDDRNLEAAMMVRQLFAGHAVETIEKPDDYQLYVRPEIYAVVYDNERTDCILRQKTLKNYKNKPYNIRTVGSMRTQYSYDGILELMKAEQAAYVFHASWVFTESIAGSDQWGTMDQAQKTEFIKEQLENYIHYEYFRHSSIAQAIHRDMLDQRQACKWDDKKHDSSRSSCRCPLCRSRITEHMRWNTYMRVNGYRYGKVRNDMAKIHDDLLPWAELNDRDRSKD